MVDVSSYGLLAFAAIFGGGMLGLLIGKVLLDRYRDDRTQKIVQSTTTMISLLAALVLGLLVAAAKERFDTSNKQIENLAADLMSLNHDLLKCGPEAKDITPLLREYVASKIAETWGRGEAGHKPGLPDPPPSQLLENVEDKLLSLAPRSESQRLTVTRALKITDDLTMTSWVQTAQTANVIPHPFILILMLWLCVLFISIGLFAPRNAVVVLAVLVSALSIASAVAMIVDMDHPFEGMIVVSPQPMQEALARISAP
jgi:hypothetical protein